MHRECLLPLWRYSNACPQDLIILATDYHATVTPISARLIDYLQWLQKGNFFKVDDLNLIEHDFRNELLPPELDGQKLYSHHGPLKSCLAKISANANPKCFSNNP